MIESLLSAFAVNGTLLKAEPFGSGLINDTYLCELQEGGTVRKYILQRINTSVFKAPEQVMANVEIVTAHILDRLRRDGVPDPSAVAPALVHARSGASFHRDSEGAYWRMYHFIETGRVYDSVQDRKHAVEIGCGLGNFQTLVSDLAPERLYETLPGFHHTSKYLTEFDDALHTDARGRAAEVRAEAEFVSRRRELAPLLVNRMNSGELPVRVVHNDPKINNIMIHINTGRALCMLDLDTVKPGIVHFDFGDCVRSVANPAGEDADLKDVTFDLSLFEAVTEGYLREAGVFLTETEIRMLPVSVKVITFELGLRFLADYLRGDTYFKIKKPAHNLDRARVQFRLLERIESAEERMGFFITEHAGR